MGCAQSKVDQEESVVRCKERKLIMKDAVSARNAFAAAQTGYAVVLKNTGAALSDYAHDNSTSSAAAANRHHPPPPPPPIDPLLQPPPPPPPPSLDTLSPPPPPPPNFSPSPIKRASSAPQIELQQHQQQQLRGGRVPIVEEEEEEEDEDEDEEEEEEELKRRPRGTRSRKNNNNNNNGDDDGVNVVMPRTPEASSNNRAVPPMPEAKNMAWDYFFMVENMPGPSLEADDDAAMMNHGGGSGEIGGMGMEVEPKTPEREGEEEEEEEAMAGELEEEEREEGVDDVKGTKQIEHSNTATPEFRMVGGNKGGGSTPSVDLMQVLNKIDDHFLKASECTQEVSKLLEATRMNYHTNFADNRGNASLLPDVGFLCLNFGTLDDCSRQF